MCGIAGILGFGERGIDLVKSANRMAAALSHRGPDAQAVFRPSSAPAIFAHTRLSIIDPEPRSNQPFTRSDRFTIVFNGEIYNYRELREELLASGEKFETHSDTEVLVALYQRHGVRMLDQIRGMYALAIWDNTKGTCLIARDPFGIKPLFYVQTSEGLVFASETEALFVSSLCDRKLSAKGVATFLRWGSCQPNASIIEGVQTLLPGQAFTWFDSDKSIKYEALQTPRWSKESNEKSSSIIEFRNAWLESIDRHLVSDVPISLFLSAGIDSAVILAGAHILKKDLRPLTLGTPGAPLDETSNARELAEHFNFDHQSFPFPAEQLLEDLFEQFLEAQDLPGIDGFNTFCISHYTKQLGFKVALSGIGGDEWFGGYPGFRRAPKLMKLHNCLSSIPFKHVLNRFALDHTSNSKIQRTLEFLENKGTIGDAYATTRSLFSWKRIKLLMQRLGFEEAEARSIVSELGHSTSNTSSSEAKLESFSRLEMECYAANQLLRETDLYGMRHSLEIRVPFIDLELSKTISRLPEEIRFLPNKQILKKAFPEIPSQIFSRPKTGFTLPWDQWIHSQLKHHFEPIDRSFSGMRLTWFQKMAILSLNHWAKNHNFSLKVG